MNVSLHDVVTQHEQEALGLLRDWATYLHAHLVILDRHDMRSAPAFDLDASATEVSAAEADLAALDPTRRALFERAVAQRREQERLVMESDLRGSADGAQRLVDPDELDRRTMRALLDEAQRPDDSGHVLFPSGDGVQIEWLELRASALAELPDPRMYRVAGRTRIERERLLRIAAGLIAVTLTVVALWMLFAPADDAAAGDQAPAASADDPSLTPWPVSTLTLVGETTSSVPLTTIATGWPVDGQAYARPAGALPLRLCAPAEALVGLREVRLAGDGSVPERIYAIGATSTPDLEIAPCEAAAGPSLAGTLQQVRVAPAPAVGAGQALGADTITLVAMSVTGPAEILEIPQGAARVALTLAGGAGMDWTALAPTLRLGDGAQQTAPEVRHSADGATELRFLVAAPREALPAEFRLTDPASRRIVRWQLSVAPPVDRLTLLARTLRVDELVATSGRDLALILTNTGDQPLPLTPADLVLESGGVRMAPAVIVGIEAALTPGETRTLTLSLPSDLRGAATLSIGLTTYRITLQEGD